MARSSTTFGPNNNANPRGRPAVAKEIKEIARQYTDEAVAALRAALKNKGERSTAASILLAYGYGKPPQAVELTGKDRGPIQFEDVSEDTRASIDSMLAEFIAAREAETETKH